MKDNPKNNLSIRLLLFEATATGALGIAAVVFMFCVYFGGKAWGLW